MLVSQIKHIIILLLTLHYLHFFFLETVNDDHEMIGVELETSGKDGRRIGLG